MVFIQSALSGNLIIPEWKKFTDIIEELFESCRDLRDGEVGIFQDSVTWENIGAILLLPPVCLSCKMGLY